MKPFQILIFLLFIFYNPYQAVGKNLSDYRKPNFGIDYVHPTTDGSSCEFYLELNRYKACVIPGYPSKKENMNHVVKRSDGGTNYLLDYGYFFCDKFGPLIQQWGSRDPRSAWSRKVRTCLQRELNERINNSSCAQIEDIAFNSHTKCYVEAGFCELNIAQQNDIFQGIGDARLFSKFRKFIDQAAGVGSQCHPNKFYLSLSCVVNPSTCSGKLGNSVIQSIPLWQRQSPPKPNCSVRH